MQLPQHMKYIQKVLAAFPDINRLNISTTVLSELGI